VKGDWRKLRVHKEELNDLYSTLSLFQVIKFRSIIWAWNVAPMEERRGEERRMQVFVGET
jgi:hypothetical protein